MGYPGTEGLQRRLKAYLWGQQKGLYRDNDICNGWNSQRETRRRALQVEVTVAANPGDKKAYDLFRDLQILQHAGIHGDITWTTNGQVSSLHFIPLTMGSYHVGLVILTHGYGPATFS